MCTSALDGYGTAGRENYAFRNLSVDILLPLSVFPFAFLLARRAAAPFVRRRLIRASILVLPFAYVTLDLVENVVVLGLLAAYPERVRLRRRAFRMPRFSNASHHR